MSDIGGAAETVRRIETAAGGASGDLFTYTVPDNCVLKCTVDIAARDATNGNSAGYQTQMTVKRHGGGAAALVGAAVPVLVNEDVAGWAGPTISVAGNNLVVTVAADAGAATVTWEGELSFVEIKV